MALTEQKISAQTGEHGVYITIKNSGATACTLKGYPTVRVLDTRGALPFGYRDGGGYVTKQPPRRVVLQPSGGTAWFVVAKSRAGRSPGYLTDRGRRPARVCVVPTATGGSQIASACQI